MANNDTATDPAATAPRLLVSRPTSSRTLWIFVGVLAIAGTGLFSALEARRGKITSPATALSPAVDTGMIMPPAELAVPSAYGDYGAQPFYLPQPTAVPQALAAPPMPSRPRSPRYNPPAPGYVPPAQAFAPTQSAPQGAAFAYRAPQPAFPGPPREGEGGNGGPAGHDRVEASRLTNPATTVPQGTIIQAVFETALDSNRAGFARAVISRDVMSFDGSRVLIPRGSKLFGEYKADLALGQNRALIQWRRLTRPDGSIIDVDSPSADPLGKAGVKGKVNSHFFTRFSGAILQSALDIGTGLATRSVGGDSYYFAVPGAMQGVVQQRPEQVKPTLTLRQGASVSVFVARDLDFTSVE